MVHRFDALRTSRLLLRRWRETDRGPFAAMNADLEVMRHFPSWLDRDGSDALVDRLEARFEEQGVGLWALEVIDTGEFIGFAGLSPLPEGIPGGGGMEVGWRLAGRAWHHGYATEAARAAVKVAFGPVGRSELWSITAVANEPSQAVMRRLGMTRHAFFGHPSLPADHPVRPHVVYHLDRPSQASPRAQDDVPVG